APAGGCRRRRSNAAGSRRPPPHSCPHRNEAYRLGVTATVPTGLFTENRPLAEALEREGAGWAAERCEAFASALGGEPLEWGRLANENPPKLRRDEVVEFHPAWHQLLGLSLDHEVHSLSWTEPREGAHVARAALFCLASQVEAGHGC